MSLPKRKNNIKVYGEKDYSLGQNVVGERQTLLDNITENDSFLPDSLLHDDLDNGMLDFVKQHFNITADDKKIPIIPKILTIQRWGEVSNNWQYVDDDGIINTPFIVLIRKPDPQPGSNPVTQRTIPNRVNFHYQTVKTWNGTQAGADVYKIPQPVAIDIRFDMTIVCNKMRDLNKLNKTVLQLFSSRQEYAVIKGHYIPIILDSIEDNSSISNVENRRFYVQTYKFTMLGLIQDSEEFEVKPAISRFLLMNEFIEAKSFTKKYAYKVITITSASFNADGTQTVFGVGEHITVLFSVTINGLVQKRNVDYYYIENTSKITFSTAPPKGSNVMIIYYKGLTRYFLDNQYKSIETKNEYFTYDGSTLTFTTELDIQSVIIVDINGLVQEENLAYVVNDVNQFTLLDAPTLNSIIGITYLY